MKIAALFLWLLVPLGLWLGVTQLGTPHVIWTYRYVGTGDPYSSTLRRHVDCTYLGWTGAVARPAEAGRCPWIRFIRAEGG